MKKFMVFMGLGSILALSSCAGLTEAFSGEVETPDGVRKTIVIIDDGMKAAQAGIDGAISTLDPQSPAYDPLMRAKPYVDQAVPLTTDIRERVDVPTIDIADTIVGVTETYRDLGLPWGEIVGGIGIGLSALLSFFFKKSRDATKNIVTAIETAKTAGNGVVDFKDPGTKAILNTMGNEAIKLVNKITD